MIQDARYLKPKQRFAANISAQGGANVPRDKQTVRTARKVIDELNEYEEEIQKIIGIYAPYPGSCHIHETRTTQWRIVAKAVEVAVHPLNLISASGAPRSPVNNCGAFGSNVEIINSSLLYEMQSDRCEKDTSNFFPLAPKMKSRKPNEQSKILSF